VLTRRAFLRSTGFVPALTTLGPVIGSADEEGYPAGPVRSICPFSPGSGADIKVRFYSNKLSLATGKPVIVENKPGAGGILGNELVANAAPDGYTLGIMTAGSSSSGVPSGARRSGEWGRARLADRRRH
jgi:tripartite-type tricarboxylate transporter receptor subunit TctC